MVLGFFSGIERRMHTRIECRGVSALVEGAGCMVRDISLGGFRVDPYYGALLTGDEFHFELVLPVKMGSVVVSGVATIVRRRATDMAARFIAPDEALLAGIRAYADATGQPL